MAGHGMIGLPWDRHLCSDHLPCETIVISTRSCSKIARISLRGAMHGNAFLAAVGIGILAVTASQGACLRPEAPSCALARIPFPSDQAADDCRKDMLKFRDAMDDYATCLGETSKDQEKAARADYEDVRVRFNQRARGEF
jgi:hypothetical protein